MNNTKELLEDFLTYLADEGVEFNLGYHDHATDYIKKKELKSDLLHSVSEIRGKLCPITNLIAMIENGVTGKTEKHGEIFNKEIDNCKRVINELAQREVYSR
ncbi:MAG: hypothetical protein S4CHLAM20_04510 [Chlamydiia bacterium]|nr:hypothetical protein [Chlamydiia bacterium]